MKGFKNVKILVPKIKKNTLMLIDGFPMRIRGEGSRGGEKALFKVSLQLRLDKENAEIVRLVEKYFEKNQREPINEKIDKITNEGLNSLYNKLLVKFKSAYLNRPANPFALMENKKELFKNQLSIEEKAECIYKLLGALRCDAQTVVDLTSIGGAGQACAIGINKNTLGKSKVEIINQSVTGLFENRKEI